jgi:Uma2 family endonuclease
MSVTTAPVPIHLPHRGPSPRPWSPDEFARMQALGLFAGRPASLAAGVVVEHVPGQPARPFAFTCKEYYALADAGFFRGQRVQLIRGVITLEPPMNPPHATALTKILMVAVRLFAVGHAIRIQLPLDLGQTVQPQPDVAIVSGSADDYAQAHPTTAVLVVEVADTTLTDDLTTQAELYATAAIQEYWVIDLPNRRLHVLRDPAPVAAGGTAYHTQRTYGPADTVAPLAAPNSPITVSDLLP